MEIYELYSSSELGGLILDNEPSSISEHLRFIIKNKKLDLAINFAKKNYLSFDVDEFIRKLPVAHQHILHSIARANGIDKSDIETATFGIFKTMASIRQRAKSKIEVDFNHVKKYSDIGDEDRKEVDEVIKQFEDMGLKVTLD